MLVVRGQQLEALQLAALKTFEDDMVAHLQQFAPKHCQVIGDPAVRQAIRLGINRGRTYGLTNRGPLRFYIELMFMYGSDFDTDPQCLWASQVLADTFPNQMTKSNELYRKAMVFTNEIAGENYVHAKAALRRVHATKYEDLPQLDGKFDDVMFAKLQQMHPEKVRALGDDSTRTVIQHGKRLPEKLSLDPNRGAALCVGAMFALGHGFGQDPLLPWIARTITNGTIADPAARVKRLHSRVMTYLDHIIAGFDK